MVTIMSVCFMSLWLIITHFHCPITSLVTSIINRNGQLYLQLAILVLFVSMFLQTPATVHFFFIINAFFTPCLYPSGMKICYTFSVAPSNLATERRCFYFGDTH